MVWHHERSTSVVQRQASATAAAGLLAPAVISPTRAPASRAAIIASIVARLAPSWLIPITAPGQGSSAASSACRAAGPMPGRPAGLHASRQMAAAAIAACSDVPHPTTAGGQPDAAPARSSDAITAAASATAGCVARRPARSGSRTMASHIR